MELCTLQAIAKLPTHHSQKLLIRSHVTDLHCSTSSLLTLRRAAPLSASLRLRSRSLCSRSFSTNATSSEDSSSDYSDEAREGVATLEDVPPVITSVYGESPEPEVTKEDSSAFEKSPEPEVIKEDIPVIGKIEEVNEEVPGDEEFSVVDFLNKLNIDTDDKLSLGLYGGGALFSLWMASAIVGAIDAIPLFPKLMELVGLGYSFWFTYRYLLFKNTREELFAKFEELKEEVVGSE